MAKTETFFVDKYKVIVITSGRLQQNCFLVKHLLSCDLLLIDPGGAAPDIIKTIDNEGGQLKLILLTHAHFDHVGGVKLICEHYAVPFWMHSGDSKLLKRAPIYAISMEKRIIEISTDYKPIDGPVTGWDGETINVIYTPGHTPGSVCFSFGKMIFSGDIILIEQDNKLELPGYNVTQLSESVLRILYTFSGDTILFPGHGKPDSIRETRLWWEKKNNLTSI